MSVDGVRRRGLVKPLALLLVLFSLIAAGRWIGSGLLLSDAGVGEDAPIPEALGVDPRTVDGAWFLERLSFPPADQARAEAAADDPVRFDAFLAEYFGQRPDVRGLPVGFIRNRAETLAHFRRGELSIGDEVKPYGLPFDWTQEASPTFHAEVHSWRFLTNLLDGWADAGDETLAAAVAAFVDDWIEHNPYVEPAHERAWHEGAVAKRTLVLINLLNASRRAPAGWPIEPSTVLALLLQQAEYLQWGEHHQQGNHGIRQDIALIALAIALPEAKAAGTWMATGLDRLERIQVATGFSSEGVWLEHSPGYQLYVMNLLDLAVVLAEENDVALDVEFLRTLGRQSEAYIAHVVTPSGLMPPVGDTDAKSPRLPPLLDGPRVRYAITGGREGVTPDTLDGFYPEAGQATLRETWGGDGRDPAESFYVHVHAAYNPPFGHRHADELSFILHGLGRWWIVEGGKYAYLKDAYRKHVVSAAAHNTYTLGGRGLRARDGAEEGLDVALEPTLVATDELGAVRGTSTRFRGEDQSRFTRTVVLLRERRTLVLLDRLWSADDQDWQGYLHLPPDAEISEADAARVVARVPTHPDLRLEISRSPEVTASVRVARGERDPLLGWISPAKGEMVPTPVVVADLHGSDLLLATVIRVVADNAAPVTGLAVVDDAEAGLDRVRWREGEVGIELTITREAPLRVGVSPSAP